MSDSKNRKIGAILSYIIIGLNMVIAVLYTPLLTSKLGQSEYGLYQYINSIIGYLTILDFGLGNAIIIYISRAIKRDEKEQISKLFSMFLIIFSIIGVIATIIGFTLYLNANSLFNSSVSAADIDTAKTLLLILLFNIAFSFPGSVFSNTINAHERFILLKVVNIISIVLKPLMMIPLLFLGYKSIALVAVTTIINFIVILINCLYCKYKLNIKYNFSGWNKKLLKEIFNYSFWIALIEIVDKVNWSVDNFLIGKIIGTIGVSIYSIASQLNQIYIQFSTAISGVLLPKIAKLNEEKNNMAKMNDIWIKSGHIQLLVIGLILSGYIIFGKQFILLWVGNEYEKSYLIGVVLMSPMIVSLIQNVAGSIIRAKNKHKFMSVVYFIIAILNVFISIPLINNYGELGAAIGTAISLVVGNIIIKNIYYKKSIQLDVIGFFKQMIPTSFAQVLLTFLSIYIVHFININNYLILGLCISIYVMLYVFTVSFTFTEYEKRLIKSYIKKLKKVK